MAAAATLDAEPAAAAAAAPSPPTTTSEPSPRGWFAVPAPVRELFKLFPLRVYPSEQLPARAPLLSRDLVASSGRRPALYIFASDEQALRGRPSYNPSCLKWQTYLRIAGIDVELVPSNNHASPSGVLPFLLVPPAPAPAPSKLRLPLTGEGIGRYARENASLRVQDISSPRLEAYEALLTQNIRPAWLHALYINPANDALLTTLYLPSSPLLRAPLRHTLRAAATAEVLKTTRRAFVSSEQLLADAETAFSSLSALLDSDDWFFGAESPGTFDAQVFAYTYLLLDEAMAWRDVALAARLAKYDNLVNHRARLYDVCWRG